MQVDLSFGEYIRRLRRERRCSSRTSPESGLSTTHLRAWRTTTGLPTTDTVVKIHHVLGGDLSVMLELAQVPAG